MSEIIVKNIICDSCGDIIEGRMDNGEYIEFSGVKSYENKNMNDLDFCKYCWMDFIGRSRNKKELFDLIKKELGYFIDYYEYVNWYEYVEEWMN